MFTYENGPKYFTKVLGEVSKNHQMDSEDMENGGAILFEENHVGFNARLYFQCFMDKLHPESQYLFSHAQGKKKGFNLKSNPDVWFTKNKMGINQIREALPTLCKALGLERYTNQQMRPTGVRLMKRGGAEDRDVVKVTGQHPETLKHYDTVLLKERQLALARSIQNCGSTSKSSIMDAGTSNSPKPSTSKSSIMDAGTSTSPKPSTSNSSIMDAGTSNSPKPSTSRSSIMDAVASTSRKRKSSSTTSSILGRDTEPLDISAIMDKEKDRESKQYDSDDSCTEVFTQGQESDDEEVVNQYLQNEQKLCQQQMELFQRQQDFMTESLKLRHEIASKRFKKK